jgi:ELWxxDGT repeat protein
MKYHTDRSAKLIHLHKLINLIFQVPLTSCKKKRIIVWLKFHLIAKIMRFIYLYLLLPTLSLTLLNSYSQPSFLADPDSYNESTKSSNPHGFVEFNGKVYFSAIDRLGKALWKSDGTNGGTQLVKRNMDMFSGIVLNHSMIFTGSDVKNVYGLWKLDGTMEEPVLITKLKNVTSYNSYIEYKYTSHAIQIDNSLYLMINNELWKIDGYSAGSYQIMDSCIGNITNIGKNIYFFSNHGSSVNLIKFDCINETIQIIYPFKSYSQTNVVPPNNLISNQDTLYFFARNDTSLSLYKSDGTKEGTKSLWGSADFQFNEFNYELLFYHDTLYYTTQNAKDKSYTVWQFKDHYADTIQHFPNDSQQIPYKIAKLYNGILLLTVVRTYTDERNGMEIFRIRGTGISDTVNLTAYNYYFSPGKVEGTDSAVYFVFHGHIWKTDGTYVLNLTSGLIENEYDDFDFALGSKFWYFAHSEVNTEKELWIGTGNAGENRLIKDINQDLSRGWINNFESAGNKVYFVTEDTVNGREPWVTDGTAGGTFMLKDIAPGSYNSQPRQFFGYTGDMYFTARRNASIFSGICYGVDTTCYLWKTNGTSDGTIPVKRLYNPYDTRPVLLNDRFYISAAAYDTFPPLAGLWASDGTNEGTVLLKAVNEPYFGAFFPTALTKVGNSIFFISPNSLNGTELWKTDGSETGTVKIKADFPSEYYGMTSIATSSLLFFKYGDTEGYTEPWVSDGTYEGTHMLADINPDHNTSYPSYMGSLGNKVFLNATNGNDNWVLYISDGTTDGTFPLKTFPYNIPRSVIFNETLYFSANDGIHGWELWYSDGTQQGTFMFKEIVPGSDGAFCSNYHEYNNLLYFTVENADGTSQIWSSDGTPENTVPLDWCLDDIANIVTMTFINNEIVFSASDAQHGNCLYTYNLEASQVKGLSPRSTDLLIYPNPAKDHIKVELSGNYNMSPSILELINSNGVVVKSFVLHPSGQTLDISDLPEGIYIIRMKSTKTSSIQRFVVL